MRILQVARTLNPAWGGTVEAVRTLCFSAQQRAVQMEVVCQDDASDPWLSNWSVPVHAAGSTRSTYGFSRSLQTWLSVHIRDYDAVLVNGVWMYLSLAVWRAATQNHVPYYLFIHGFLDPWFRRRYPLKHVKKMFYWRAFEHKVLRDAAAVLFTTEEEEVLARNSFLPYRAKAVIAGFGCRAPVFDNPAADRSALSQEFSGLFPNVRNRPYLLFFGRIHEKKGVDLLLKAFAQVMSANSDLALVVVGPGDPEIVETTKALASELGLGEKVVFTGPLYGEAKWTALRGADAFVLPSHQENFGISVVESLACGTPVLLSDKVNIWREVVQTSAGLVASDTLDGTAELLNRWLAFQASEKQSMGSNARQCFAEHFDATHCSDRLFALMKSGTTADSLPAPSPLSPV